MRMKYLLSVAAIYATLSAGCIKTTPARVVKSVLDVAQVACILVNDHLDDANQLAKICDVADEYIDDVRQLVAARKKAAAMKAAAAKPEDAGSAEVK